MGVFSRFRRQDQSVLPEEVKQYYQSEQRQRTGVALLLGVAALVITVLVASGLFYGGRYVYRQINENNNQTASQETQDQDTSGTQNEAVPAETPNNTSDDVATTPASPETSTPAPTPNPAPAPAPTPAPATPPASSPSLGDDTSPKPLPRTGDEGL